MNRVTFELNGMHYEMEALAINVTRERHIGDEERIVLSAEGYEMVQGSQMHTDHLLDNVRAELKRMMQTVMDQRAIIEMQAKQLRGECL